MAAGEVTTMRSTQLPRIHGWLIILLGVISGASTLPASVVITEIHYEPAQNTAREEFLELYNTSDQEVELSGWYFSEGVRFTFPTGTRIAARAYVVIAEDPGTLATRLGFSGALGPFSGALSNSGERVVLRNAIGEIEDEVDYGVGFPWPLASAGDGSSMELIDPELDNDLGGSWRASGLIEVPTQERVSYLDSGAADWRYRRGTSEPDPAWRELAYAEDATWSVGSTSIGFGDDDDSTILTDMLNNYTTIYLRRRITLPAGPLPTSLKIELYVDDGAAIWINGVEVLRVGVLPGSDPAHNATSTRSVEAAWDGFLLPNPQGYLVAGENLLAIHVLNRTLTSGDLSIDARLFRPASDDITAAPAPPSPGKPNTVLAAGAPPQVRQVEHALVTPSDQQDNTVSAKISDPDGVARVRLYYQVVLPGDYIPAFLPVPLPALLANSKAPRPPNPDFEDPGRWMTVEMHDDGRNGDLVAGDETFSALVPRQLNRALVRYRIDASDTSGHAVRVPYRDDPSLNFAYMVYNGLPDYAVATSILGQPTVHSREILSTLPVYFLLTRNRDLLECIAPNASQQIDQSNPARNVENWEGAWVHDGVVHDHINYRLRGGNGRYQNPPDNPANIPGKRKYKIDFNRGRHFQARDRLGNRHVTRWEAMNVGRMFGNRLDGNWSLSEQVNDTLWGAHGVPAPYHHSFHFRVIDGLDEAPAGAAGQYTGDFWGIAHAFEYYDGQFLEARGLPRGNLYKLTNRTDAALEQFRYQAPFAVSNGSDHNNIEANLRASQTDAWLQNHVDYEQWYRYHAIVQAVRHYDYWASANKNVAWYFYPSYSASNNFLGQLWTLPDDTDATWGPNWNNGVDRPFDAIFGPPAHAEMQKEYRNHIRELRDLLWQRDQLQLAIRHTASFLDAMEEADIDRWRNAPAEAGRQYFPSAAQRNLEAKFQDMMRFAFTGGSWPDQDVGPGGRAAFLDQYADGPHAAQLPAKPTIIYTGPEGFPIDQLQFESSPFSDPQGATTFRAMKWRLAEISNIPNPGTLSLDDPRWRAESVRLEITPVWESEELMVFEPRITLPITGPEPGRKYRVRVRMQDQSSLWSHWSDPIELIASPPTTPPAVVTDLRITEIQFNPLGGSDFEFLELLNIGDRVLDLDAVRFAGGVEFDFALGTVRSLNPGEFVVVVKDLPQFRRRFPSSSILVAGEFSGNLDNGGERLHLRFGNLDVLELTYDDAWYPLADGGGFSLNIRDVRAPAAAWDAREGWFQGSVEHGTPGALDPGTPVDGRMKPGDSNRDGKLDLADAIALLFRLFVGAPVQAAPCTGVLESGNNLLLLDHNGDGQLNVTDVVHLLSYIFRGGPAHAHGTACLALDGCTAAPCGG